MMVVDKHGVKLEEYDIVRYDPNEGMPLTKSGIALIVKDFREGLLLCDCCGVSKIISDYVEKVDHFPSKRYTLPADVKYAYLGYLRKIKLEIDIHSKNFLNKANGAYRRREVKEDG